MKNYDRREFVNKIWKGARVIALAEFSWIGFSFFEKEEKKQGKAELFDAGLVSEFSEGSISSFRSRRFYLIRETDGGFLAVSTSCTHLGCAINWDEKEQKFICPCHASQFSKNGNVLNPPATRPLDILEVSFQNGNVFVNLDSQTKRALVNKSQLVYA